MTFFVSGLNAAFVFGLTEGPKLHRNVGRGAAFFGVVVVVVVVVVVGWQLSAPSAGVVCIALDLLISSSS